MHIFRLWRKHVQSFKKICIRLYEELCSCGTHCLYIDSEKWLSAQCGKNDKKKKKNWSDSYIQITTTSSYHEEKHAKFHNDRYKTVRGVALTRGTHCLYIEDEKWLSSQCGKSDKNNQTIISKPYAHSHTMKKLLAKFHNNRYKTVRGVALTRGTHYLYRYIEGEKWLSSQCEKSDK